MTTYEAENILLELLETVRGLPSDTDVISLNAARSEIEIHTYNSDMGPHRGDLHRHKAGPREVHR